MSFGGDFIAVDWGTTNRRIFVIEKGGVVRTERDGRGVTSVKDFPGEATALRTTFGDLPMLMAGMVGSNIGWEAAPYVAAPAGTAELAAALHFVDKRTAIVPGVCVADPADVMRGEEVQFLGAVEDGLAPRDGLLVQPGTHCKWTEVENGRIARFTTAMTGELFALLRNHGLLASQLGGEVVARDAFRAGVEEGRKRDLLASLFGIRAAKLLGERDDRDAAAYASGLLIGSDVAARLEGSGHDTAFILADPIFGGLYGAAIEAHGLAAILVDSHRAFAAGIIAIGHHA